MHNMKQPMSDTESGGAFGKKISLGFADHIGQEKDQRIARQSLRDLMLFNNALESELKHLHTQEKSGAQLDKKLIEKMQLVKEKYTYAMSGFKAFDDDMQRSALTALAESIKDLMIYLNARRSH